MQNHWPLLKMSITPQHRYDLCIDIQWEERHCQDEQGNSTNQHNQSIEMRIIAATRESPEEMTRCNDSEYL
jgi:hypothetical protein